jgi:hypothetical protein
MPTAPIADSAYNRICSRLCRSSASAALLLCCFANARLVSISPVYAAFYVALYSLAAGVLHVHRATFTPKPGATASPNQAYNPARRWPSWGPCRYRMRVQGRITCVGVHSTEEGRIDAVSVATNVSRKKANKGLVTIRGDLHTIRPFIPFLTHSIQIDSWARIRNLIQQHTPSDMGGACV